MRHRPLWRRPAVVEARSISSLALDRAGVTLAVWVRYLPVVVFDQWVLAGIGPAWPGWLISLVAWLASGATLGVAYRAAIVHLRPGTLRQYVTLLGYGLAGVTTWAATVWLAGLTGVTAAPAPLSMFIISAIVWLLLAAVLEYQRQRSRQAMAHLQARRAELESAQADAAAELAATSEDLAALSSQVHQAVQAARNRIRTATTDADLAEIAAGLSATVRYLIRPLSHRLARDSESEASSRDHSSAVATPQDWRVTVRLLVRTFVNGYPFQPVAVTAICLPLVLVAVSGPNLSLRDELSLVLGLALQVALLIVANNRWHHHAQRLGTGPRIVWIFAVYLAMPLLYLLAAQLASPGSEPYRYAAAFVPLFVATTAAGAADMERLRRGAEDEQLRLLDQERWEMAATTQRLWAMRRRLGVAIHGRVQAGMTASELLLRSWVGSPPPRAPLPEVLDRVDRTLIECQAAVDDPSSPEITQLLDDLVAVWQGVMTVELEVSPHARAQLGADDSAAAATGEILRELLLNAARHGQADAARVRITSYHDDVLELQVRAPDRAAGADAGARAADGAGGSAGDGMGTALIDSLALAREVLISEGTRTTTVLLAILPALDPAAGLTARAAGSASTPADLDR